MINLEQFLEGYIEAALWSTTDVREDETTYKLDDEFSTVSLNCRNAMQSDCEDFTQANEAELVKFRDITLGGDYRLGFLFWLNRSGHGSGFWDEAIPGTEAAELGERLSDAAKIYNTFELFGDFEMGCVRSHHYG